MREYQYGKKKYNLMVTSRNSRTIGAHANAMLAIYYSVMGRQADARKVMEGIFNLVGYRDCDSNSLIKSNKEVGEQVAVYKNQKKDSTTLGFLDNATCAMANYCIGENKLGDALRNSMNSSLHTAPGRSIYLAHERSKPNSRSNIAAAIAFMMKEYLQNG